MVKRRWPALAAALLAGLVLCAAPRAQDGTAALTIEVAQGPAQPVVGEMILVTIRGVYDLTITRESLEVPRVDGYEWVQLDRDRWTEERIGGKVFSVMRRRLAVFPEKPGRITVGPFVHRVTHATRGGRRQLMETVAAPVDITVAPFPGAPGDWPLAARALEYTDTWSQDPSTLTDGETVTRTVTLTALGVMPEDLPPQPPMREPWLITFSPPEQRSVERTLEGPVSTVTWTWHLRPITGEPGVIGRHRIPWFDTTRRTMEAVVLDPAPFGYRSFGESRAGLTAGGFEGRLPLALSAIAGAALASLLLFRGLRVGTGVALAHLRDRLRVARLRAGVRRAGRHGDLVALRLATGAYLADPASPRDARLRAAVAALDRRLYGRDTSGAFDIGRFLAAFARRPGRSDDPV